MTRLGMIDTPANLVAVAKAAHESGDRDLERAARRLLAEQHGIRITFERANKKRGGSQ